jgi:hypothetical protein
LLKLLTLHAPKSVFADLDGAIAVPRNHSYPCRLDQQSWRQTLSKRLGRSVFTRAPGGGNSQEAPSKVWGCRKVWAYHPRVPFAAA